MRWTREDKALLKVVLSVSLLILARLLQERIVVQDLSLIVAHIIVCRIFFCVIL